MTVPPVSTLDFLNRALAFLARHGAATPRLDAEVLLAHVLGCARIDLYVRFEQPLSEAEIARYRTLVQARGRGTPVAYLTGRREFFSLGFHVTPAVLVPRPETEHLVEAGLAVLAPEATALVADVGTGSGCVALAVAHHRPGVTAIATDISAGALEVARRNAAELELAGRVHLLRADLLDAVRPGAGGGPFQVILSNPPYVARGELPALDREIRDFEPRTALVAGAEGIEPHRRLVAAAVSRLARGGALYMEVGAGQAAAVAALVEAAFGNVEVVEDLGGVPRVVGGKTL